MEVDSRVGWTVILVGYWSVVSGNSKGVAILFNRNQKFDVSNVQISQTGRIMSLTVKLDDKCMKIVCVYAPNKDTEKTIFYPEIEEHMDSEHYNIVLGDFNCTLNDMDRSPGDTHRRSEVGRGELKEFTKKKKIYDPYRRRNPSKSEFTYFKPNSNIKSRIDLVLIDESIDPWVKEIKTRTAIFSDHNAVTAKLNISDTERGPGRWKMSARIQSTLFKETFRNFWESHITTTKDEFASKKMWWVETKEKIKELARWCSHQINKKERGEIKRLEDKILMENNKAPNQVKLETLRTQLEQINQAKCDGARLRAGVKWFEEGERSSAYFHGLEKKRTTQRTWSSIKKEKWGGS